MKRKASSAFEDDEAGEPRRAPPRLDDNLIAEEILPRLPARATAACAVGTLRGILTGLDYWRVRNRRLPRPRAACLAVTPRSDGGAGFRHEFHYADTAFPNEPVVVRAAGGGTWAPFRYAGTCNGLVLLTSPWDNGNRARGVLFNPASGEEEAVVLDLACGGGGKDVFRCFCGFGYSPSSKTYKALVCTRDFFKLCLGCAGELVVVPFGGAAAAGNEKPRTVAKMKKLSESREDYFSSLTLDGKVYVLPAISASASAAAVMAFDVDDETVAHIRLPPPSCYAGHGYVSKLMEVWGRPCIAVSNRKGSALWALTPDHRWERRCAFAAAPRPTWGGVFDNHQTIIVDSAWDCSGGDGKLLFVLFLDGRGFMYDLGKTTEPDSLATYIDCDLGKPSASMAELRKGTGYVCPEKHDGLKHFSSGRRSWADEGATRRCLEELMETMRIGGGHSVLRR
uniref:F-box associated beta-propeller type 3 domain-containing protein n=1 Tax=Setaria viridis TaxID=4556 RepID=A0A4U6TCL0_SETVI|nr:hypothetical protein SEVIR_8G068500v2 [Setaria viridis]